MAIPPPLPTKAKSNDRIIIGASVVLAIIVVCGAGVGGVMIAKRAQARREAINELTQGSNEERAKMAENIRSGKTDGADAAIGRVKDQLGKSADQLGGADAKAARAMATWLDKLQKQMKDYESSVTRLKGEKVLSFEISDRAGIEAKRQVVRDFLASNARLTNLFLHSEEIVRAEMDAAQVPAGTRDATLAAYVKGQSAQRPLLLKIRGCDKTLGESELEILDLLDQNLGRWQRDEATGHLRFQDNATLTAFNASFQKIKTASVEQKNAQEQLAAQMKAGPPQ